MIKLQHPQTPPVVRAWVTHPLPWSEVRQPQQRLEAAQFSNLGAGEWEDITLAQELHVPWLLMDDPEGREEATQRALRTTGTLEVLEQAAIDGLLDLPTVLTQLLATTTFRAGAGLLQELLARDTACKANPPTDGR
jgi:predicted nucleic acid-binding protein